MASGCRAETWPQPQPQHDERKTRSIVTSDGDDITKLTSKFSKSSEEGCCSVTYVVDWR